MELFLVNIQTKKATVNFYSLLTTRVIYDCYQSVFVDFHCNVVNAECVLGLTLASQWKSQFDDSEETTDNEWKGENLHSPEHRITSSTQVSPH